MPSNLRRRVLTRSPVCGAPVPAAEISAMIAFANRIPASFVLTGPQHHDLTGSCSKSWAVGSTSFVPYKGRDRVQTWSPAHPMIRLNQCGPAAISTEGRIRILPYVRRSASPRRLTCRRNRIGCPKWSLIHQRILTTAGTARPRVDPPSTSDAQSDGGGGNSRIF